MSIPITDKFKPRNNGTFPLVDAVDVEMPDGTRLSDFKGGASITVDSELSDTSTNPVQNKVLYAYFQQALEALGALQDSIPTEAQINALIDARFVPMTQAEYDALTEVDPNKYYMIVGDSQ